MNSEDEDTSDSSLSNSSKYSFFGSSDEEADEYDDNLFNDNIDKDVEWVGNYQTKNSIEDKIEQGEMGEDDILESEDDFGSSKDSDSDTEGKPFPVFNSFEIHDPTFELGMLFNNKKEFRKAVHSCAIKSKRNVKITKNDKIRIYGKCADTNCGWKIHATKLKNEETFQVREYVSHHTCAPNFHVKNVKSSWLCAKYVQKFKFDPKRKVKGFRLEMMQELRCNITHYQAYRAKNLALEMLEGNVIEQFSLLWSYADEIKRTNPGSTVVIGTDQSNGESIFDRMYVFLYALKMGFAYGCMPLVGVDGCHLKGPNGGVLLTAVGLDPNNNIYPLAYVVVGKENRDTWEWFLTLFKIDMHVESDYGWTFMSDKQKGLIQAFNEVFPNAEHRFCVRHMHSNFKNAGFRGQTFKSIVWKAARATTANEFKRAMREMEIIDIKAFEWFNDKPPHQWSRSYFSCRSRTDILLNNLCETFNGNILEAREMPILSMMEWIMEYLMKRLQINRDRAQKKWK